jgi:hypothetical protein
MGFRRSSAKHFLLVVSTVLFTLATLGLAGCSGGAAPADPEREAAEKKAFAEESVPVKSKSNIKSPSDLRSIKGRLIQK